MSINYENPIYCIVTGASRGIGRTIAIETARRAKNKIVLVLVARSEKNLTETKNLVLEVNKNAIVHLSLLDLSKPDVKDYENVLKTTLVDFKDPFSAIIFHNAGQIGEIDKSINLSDVKTWQDYFTLNVVSIAALNSVFVNNVKELTQNVFVVNITSLLGRKAFEFFSMYGSGKAARDLYFQVLAEEEKYIRVLNWSPGMVETDMADELLTIMDKLKGTSDKETAFRSILKSEQTINKMFKVLDENNFISGDIIDYHDVE